MDLQNRNVLVVGMGRTGDAVARFCIRRGAAVRVSDASSADQLGERVGHLQALGVKLELGGHRLQSFTRADLIVLSPGVPDTIEPLRAARAEGVPVVGEIELAFGFIKEPIVAVTGTNGKTTTTTLIGQMLAAAGLNPFVGGNIGNPLISYLDSGQKAGVLVVEVSSFQLDTVKRFRPAVGVLLNIADDHLDRYPDRDAYGGSKARLFACQGPGDTAVVNGVDAQVAHLTQGLVSRRLPFYHWRLAPEVISRGAVVYQDHMVLQQGAREPVTIDLKNFRLPGAHQRENAAAAALAALAAGGTLEGVERTLASFQGLAHRMEFVATVNGSDYFNDSKATNVAAVRRALESFSRPVILILGGRDKASDFDKLRGTVRQRVKRAVLLGEAREKIQRALEGATTMEAVDSMARAVAAAHADAEPGDVVLLSPACASFDMYADYGARGDDFKALVRKL